MITEDETSEPKTSDQPDEPQAAAAPTPSAQEAPAASAAAPAMIATAEYWAEKLGYLPRILPAGGEFVRPNPKYQDFAQAKAHGNWPEGKELTEAEFMKAIDDAKDPKAHIFR